MIARWELADWQHYCEQSMRELDFKPVIFVLTTPFCGTCKLTMHMVQILAMSKPNWMFVELSSTPFADLMQQWKIESVPCILILERNQELKRWYRVGSVTELWQNLTPYIKDKEENTKS